MAVIVPPASSLPQSLAVSYCQSGGCFPDIPEGDWWLLPGAGCRRAMPYAVLCPAAAGGDECMASVVVWWTALWHGGESGVVRCVLS